MMRAVVFLVALCPLAAAAANAPRGDVERGAALHATHCAACHGDEVYTRENRRIRSLDGLIRQVQACNRNIGAGLSPDEVRDVIDYLNERYYHFE